MRYSSALELTDNKIVHADVTLARNLLALEIVVSVLMNGQMVDETNSLCYLYLFVFGQLLRAMTHAR